MIILSIYSAVLFLQDIKDWERRAGKKYYDLSATERIAANEEMTRFKKEGVAATTA